MRFLLFLFFFSQDVGWNLYLPLFIVIYKKSITKNQPNFVQQLTTNYVKELGPHLTNRPGRFNKLIQVLPPSDEEIFELVEGVGGIKLTEQQKQAFKGRNMTPDHVIEAIIRHELDDISLEQLVNEVLSEREGIVNWNA